MTDETIAALSTLPKSEIARRTGLSRPTVHRALSGASVRDYVIARLVRLAADIQRGNS